MPLTVIAAGQPSNTTEFERGTATFYTVGSASSAANISYQWQVGANNAGYSNITGSTASSHSFEVALTDSGEWYRCVITATGQNGAVATANTAGAQLSAIADSRVAYARFGEAGYDRYLRLRNLGYV